MPDTPKSTATSSTPIAFFILFGLATLWMGAPSLLRARRIEANGTLTTGKIVAILGGRRPRSHYEFNVGGDRYWGTGEKDHFIGERVPVAYLPENPAESVLASDPNILSWLAVCASAGAFAMATRTGIRAHKASR